jgi:arginase family enzyme
MGPRAIREASAAMAEKLRRAEKEGLFELNTKRTWFPRLSQLVDVGDAEVQPADVGRTTEAISRLVFEIVKRGALAVTVGGDHYITYPACVGAARGALLANSTVKIGYLQVDGHLDFYDEIPVWGRFNHGTNARRTAEVEGISPRNMAWIGVQGWVGKEPWETIQKNGARVLTARDVHALGPREAARQAAEHALNSCHYVYVSFDIDGMETAFAPGTGGVVFGGITPEMYLEIADELSKLPMLALDLTEVSPRLDYSDRTSRIATEVILRLILPRLSSSRGPEQA